MKPLEITKIKTFLKRFNHFRECEFRSLEVVDATTFQVSYAVQDEAKEFDWITLTLEFSGVSDARLLDNDKMSFVDMADGLSIMTQENSFAFGVGQCQSYTCITNATYYIIAKHLKYKEGAF